MQDWKTVTHEETGISCELGRLTWRQRPILAGVVAEVWGPVRELVDLETGQARKGVSELAQARAVRNAVDSLDEATLKPIFDTKVRNVQGLGEGAMTGLELLEEAPSIEFIMWLVSEMVNEATPTEEEGKASDSPSTSSTGPTADSASPAESIEPAAGASPSTVTETQTEGGSSSRVA